MIIFLKNEKQFQPVSHSVRLLCYFLRTISEILGTGVKGDTLMSS